MGNITARLGSVLLLTFVVGFGRPVSPERDLVVTPELGHAHPGPTQQCPLPAEATADAFLVSLSAGEPLDCAGVAVHGDLDLRSLRTIHGPIRCVNCTLDGSLRAGDVIFEEMVDLSGTQISGSLDLRGTVFRKQFLMTSTEARIAEVGGGADLSLSTFEDTVQLDRLVFSGSARFVSSRFVRGASLEGANFLAPADFSGAAFEGDLFLSGASEAPPDLVGGSLLQPGSPQARFSHGARFERARFNARADFSARTFDGPVVFDRAIFDEGADFGRSQFNDVASFRSVQFLGGATFRGVLFAGEAHFEFGTANGTVEFVATTFSDKAEFFGFATTGTLDFRDVIFGGKSKSVDFSQASAKDLWMSPGLVSELERATVRSQFLGLENALSLLETTGREKGDTLVANEARFQLLALQSADASGIRQIGNYIYRYGLGYLVRPDVPLETLALIILTATIMRVFSKGGKWVREQRRRAKDRHRPRSLLSHRIRKTPVTIARAIADILGELAATLRVVSVLDPKIKIDDREKPSSYVVAFVHWVEFLAYKLLEASFLIGLGNANPTARQLIEAVLRGGRP